MVSLSKDCSGPCGVGGQRQGRLAGRRKPAAEAFFLSPFSQRGLTQGVIDDMKHFRIFVGSVLALGAAPAVWAESAGGIPADTS